jgi:D-alanyl-lipoteichoic acid acyltransferase DltB (MBOAT superfamily)
MWLVAMRIRSVTVRQALYLVASWLFYLTWGSWLIVVLLFSSVMNYALGEWLKKRISAGRLWTGIIFNLALLSVFKYLPLLGTSAPSGSPLLIFKRILFPAGVSYWTFQALSYLFEIYREEELNPTLLEFCLYMSFWPTVLQGPICRMSSMLPQFREAWSVTDDDLKTGVRRVAIGILMSCLALVVAGGLYAGAGVEAVFNNTAARFSGIDVWFMIIGYGFQLYFSFCGFCHIVIGGARLFGIRVQENFNRPYLSTTISEFWTRWHMSLSFWIRDFLFLPLATMRREAWWRNLSLVIAMFVFGLWHQGSFLLMLWGIWHGHGDLLVADVFRSVHRLHFLSRGKRPSGLCHAEGARFAARLHTPESGPQLLHADAVGGGRVLRGHRRQYSTRSFGGGRAHSSGNRAGPLVELARHPGQRTLGVDHSRDRGAGNLFERDFPARPRRNRAGDVRAVLEKP